MMTKTCSRCHEIKDLSLFYKQTALRPKDDGLDYLCKICRNASTKKTLKNNSVKCTAQGCGSPNYARKLCKCCYYKLTRQEAKNK